MEYNNLFDNIMLGTNWVEISRSNLKTYSGICRRVYVKAYKIRIDYIDYTYLESFEGEESFYFSYNCSDDVIFNAKIFIQGENIPCLNKSIDEWCFLKDDMILSESWNNFYNDLQLHQLLFPSNFSEFVIKTIYATAIYLGIVKITDDEKTIRKSLKEYRSEINNARRFFDY